MKYPVKSFLYLLLLLFALSCGDDPVVTPEPEPKPKPEPEEPGTEEPAPLQDWFSWEPAAAADADKVLTIRFKAPKDTELYGYTGEVYAHIGVVSEGTWKYVPAEWEENIAKCRMLKIEGEANAWELELTPSIREWFNSEETPVNKIGIVVRSADTKKKGNKDGKDFFIENITDSKYKPFQPGVVRSGSMPAGLQHGINMIDNSTVTLVLYDKDKDGARKDFAHLVGDFNNWTLSNDEQSQMFRDDAAGCWWITLTGLEPTKEYAFQYYLGNSGKEPFRVADPYARKVLDPNNDKYISPSTYPENLTYPEGAIGMVSVFKIQEEEYHWKVTDFEKPSRDNLVIYELLLRDFTESGDIKGAMAKLDYLQSLGVNAIELMPVQEFDGNDSWGYNPAFFFAMDKAYGTDRMYKEFIDECHSRGIAVILDVVYNHATGDNPFAKMWWDASADKTTGNNPYFNVNAPHPYSVFHDFNHESELVRTFVKRNLQFLLDEYNIDGFRFDLTKGFTQRSSTESTASNYDASRIAILKDYNQTIKAVDPDVYVILEHFADSREETELSNDGMMVWRNNNDLFKRSAKGFQTDFSPVYYGSSDRPVNSLVSYMESHDEERTAYVQLSEASTYIKNNLGVRMSLLSANAAFFFTVPGPKMVWQFGELGYDFSINENGRLGRKPIKWDYLLVPERKELHDTYSTLINLRMEHGELFNATSTLSWSDGRYLTLSSFGKAKNVMVIANFTDKTTGGGVSFPQTGVWHNYLENGTTIYVPSPTMNVELPPYSFKIYTNFEP
ncbi:MAG: alpha-amylase family glycosyl hydrolase [Proteiniphilum sp.]|nr:alpha-amylase family glycosyl hydrolase [Proteiniphilum sp.]